MNHYHYLFSNYILLPHLAMKVQVVLLGLDVLLGQDQLVDLKGGPELFEEGETLPDSQKTGQILRNLTQLYFVQSNRYEGTYYS